MFIVEIFYVDACGWTS